MDEEKKRFHFIGPVKESLKKSLDLLLSFFRWKHIDQLLLMPITMWSMVENTFLTAQFTRVRKISFE